MNLDAFSIGLAIVAFVALLAMVGRSLGAWSRAALPQERGRACGDTDVHALATLPLPVGAERAITLELLPEKLPDRPA